MLFRAVLPVAMALSQTVTALPSPAGADGRLDDVVEHVVYKRGDVLTPRDLEFAKRHKVDINQMYRHSVLKRSNGDDYTIWIHNSFNDTSDMIDPSSSAENEARLRTRQSMRSEFYFDDQSGHSNVRQISGRCDMSSGWTNTVNPDSAFTGGGNAIMNWVDANWGYFVLGEYCCPDDERTNVIVAGSNSGANLRYGVGVHPSDWGRVTNIGTWDIHEATGNVFGGRQNFGDGDRMEGHGEMRCFRPTNFFGNWVAWVLHRSVEEV